MLSQKAAAAHKGLFAPSACGIGPNQGHPIGLWAQWDADGNDRDDVNGEYVKIRNYDVNNWLPLDRLVPARLGPAALHLPARLRHPAEQLRHASTPARARTPAPTSTGA